MKLRYRRVSLRETAASVQMERMLDYLWDASRNRGLGVSGEWRPSADVYQTADALAVVVELAGMDEEEIIVTLFADVLVIEGERLPSGLPQGDYTYHEAGIRYGRFRVEVLLPAPVEADQTQARYENGFLTIILPKQTVQLRKGLVGDG